MDKKIPFDVIESFASNLEAISGEFWKAELNPVDIEDFEGKMNEAKEDLKGRYPTYNALLELAARQSVTVKYRMQQIMSITDRFFSDNALMFLEKTFPNGDADLLTKDNQLSPEMLATLRQLVSKDLEKMNAYHVGVVKSETRALSSILGAGGAKVRADRYAPLKEKAIELAKAGKFASANHAAEQIAPVILEMPEAKNTNFSKTRAVQTIGNWFRKDGIDFSGHK